MTQHFASMWCETANKLLLNAAVINANELKLTFIPIGANDPTDNDVVDLWLGISSASGKNRESIHIIRSLKPTQSATK